MYDMYPWDDAKAAQTPPPQRPRPRRGAAAQRPTGQAAVQVALDRRDNGGDPADEAK
jgi:hypothetical protein